MGTRRGKDVVVQYTKDRGSIARIRMRTYLDNVTLETKTPITPAFQAVQIPILPGQYYPYPSFQPRQAQTCGVDSAGNKSELRVWLPYPPLALMLGVQLSEILGYANSTFAIVTVTYQGESSEWRP